VDGDANIIFGAAFDPALDGKIRVSVVATGMDEVVLQKIESTPMSTFHDTRRPTPGPFASRSEPVRAPEPVRATEPVRAAESVRNEAPRIDHLRAEAAPVTPTFSAPPPTPTMAAMAAAAAARQQVQAEPVIHVAEERTLAPIVDPWVEEFEADRGRAPAVAQGDLYMDRSQPAAREPEPMYEEPAYDDRDHRKSGWSLFGKKPRAQSNYAPPPMSRTAPQMRPTSSAQVAPEPETSAGQDDLEIPSFLRRLAN
jgi:cell division protein FtsZ